MLDPSNYSANRKIKHCWGSAQVSYKPTVILTNAMGFQYKKVRLGHLARDLSYYLVSYYQTGTVLFLDLFQACRPSSRQKNKRAVVVQLMSACISL